jgi:transposase InsO family protein
MLTLLDEHSRRCLAVHVGWSIRAVDMITVVEAAFARYGKPQHLRSDNGPEFIASGDSGLAGEKRNQDHLHQAWQPWGERSYRELP